ncbi:class D beta-lactamase [Planktotalea sp.]|uniref:class D beta-lactamase n=1 Tax=Planktotalea sp. TaxID=2029877 RepID=UPI0032996207
MTRFFIVLWIAMQTIAHSAQAQEVVNRSDLFSVFAAENTTGTFVLIDVKNDRMTLVNKIRAYERFIPASTFKFANSLIALETQAISSVDEVIPYGGKPQIFKSWEKDMALGEAFAASNVPVYQELARRVGLQNYTQWLAKLQYGNGAVGEAVERFWLDGPLTISAVEQAQFMSALAQSALPLSQNNQRIVQQIAHIETHDSSALQGKTGWTIAPDPDIGWFVGWVESEGAIYAFALNMDMAGRSDAPLRTALARQFLQALNVYK